MDEGKTSYEFCITIVGVGSDVDEAFQDALDRMKDNPDKAIEGEVIYAKVTSDVGIDIEN